MLYLGSSCGSSCGPPDWIGLLISGGVNDVQCGEMVLGLCGLAELIIWLARAKVDAPIDCLRAPNEGRRFDKCDSELLSFDPFGFLVRDCVLSERGVFSALVLGRSSLLEADGCSSSRRPSSSRAAWQSLCTVW